MCEALLRRPPSKPFHACALEHVFLLCRRFSAFWPARFSTSSRPIVIFRLISFRLVRHDRFIFFIFVFSLCLFCLPRNVFTFVLYYLAILAKHMNITLSASDGMRVLSLCRQSGWHIRTRSRSWGFWKFWQDIGLHSEGSWWKFSACHPVRDAIDLSHNCARDPKKKPRERQCRAKDLARTANLQSFRTEKQEMASLSTSFFRL